MMQMSQPKPEKHTYLNPVYCLNFAEVDEVVGDGVDGEAGLGVDVELGDDVAHLFGYFVIIFVIILKK